MERGSGRHFTFDGVVKDIAIINVGNVTEFLDRCPDEIKMTKITLPNVYEIGGKIIGFIMIAESHISFHGDIYSGLVSIDVFSCMFFQYNDILLFVKKYFPCDDNYIPNFLQRGLELKRF